MSERLYRRNCCVTRMICVAAKVTVGDNSNDNTIGPSLAQHLATLIALPYDAANEYYNRVRN